MIRDDELERIRAQRSWMLAVILFLAALLYLSLHLSSAHQRGLHTFGTGDLPTVYRDDLSIVFHNEVYEKLQREYLPEGPEHFYCLTGWSDGRVIHVDGLHQQDTLLQTDTQIIYRQDPPCQLTGAVGSIHTHPVRYGCAPSSNDFFTFGEMKNPEPLINIIQCGFDHFYILGMPQKHGGLDHRPIPWKVEP